MKKIPRPALWLGFAGLLPFLAAVLVSYSVSESLNSLILGIFNQVSGPFLLVAYAKIICAFMAGVLWGYAAKSKKREWLTYSLSVLPALWVLFTVTGSIEQQLSALIVGFLLVFVIELQFKFWGLVPNWWLSLRIPLTTIVVLCLLAGIFA